MIPMPRRVTFTRDVEFEPDGTAYTSISNFPAGTSRTGSPR